MKEADTNKRVSASFDFTPTDSNKREGKQIGNLVRFIGGKQKRCPERIGT
ncbi:hypothetical protein EVA_14041, partial [gut metagenome]